MCLVRVLYLFMFLFCLCVSLTWNSFLRIDSVSQHCFQGISFDLLAFSGRNLYFIRFKEGINSNKWNSFWRQGNVLIILLIEVCARTLTMVDLHSHVLRFNGCRFVEHFERTNLCVLVDWLAGRRFVELS